MNYNDKRSRISARKDGYFWCHYFPVSKWPFGDIDVNVKWAKEVENYRNSRGYDADGFELYQSSQWT